MYILRQNNWTLMLRKLYIFIIISLIHTLCVGQPRYGMADSITQMQGWDLYPTYGLYCRMMRNYASQYPDRASLVEVGRSVCGRSILGLRLTAPGDTTLRSPVLVSSSIHGNETTGYLLSLRLIDSLCRSNLMDGSRLLSRCVIYILPLLNPDGTYRGGDSTVAGGSRENANNVDLNRNFSAQGGQTLEPETMAIMSLARSRRFAFSVSLHGGDEVVNYPWDSYLRGEMSLPDLEWWSGISQRYVATCRALDSTYLRSVNQEGHVFGSDWYKVHGGMQDWMYQEMRCRETTIELSNTKTIDPSRLGFYWNLTRQALTDFLENAAIGFCGTVSDWQGNAIEGATILMPDHDENFSTVTSRSDGSYFRPTTPHQRVEACALAYGYATQCMSVDIGEGGMEELSFRLHELDPATACTDMEEASETVRNTPGMITMESRRPMARYQVYNTSGQPVISGMANGCTLQIPTHNLQAGIYVVKIENGNTYKTHKIAVLK